MIVAVIVLMWFGLHFGAGKLNGKPKAKPLQINRQIVVHTHVVHRTSGSKAGNKTGSKSGNKTGKTRKGK
jgi:hypothetical protein